MPPVRKSKEVQYASFLYRMLASIIDTVLSAILLTPIIKFLHNVFDISKTGLLFLPTGDIDQERAIYLLEKNLMDNLPALLMEMTIVTTIIIIFWVKKGGTPGKMLLKMKIVDAKTHQTPGTLQSIVRYLGYFASVIPFFLGFIWIYYDKRKQGFHDKIARTVVIIDKGDKEENIDNKE